MRYAVMVVMVVVVMGARVAVAEPAADTSRPVGNAERAAASADPVMAELVPPDPSDPAFKQVLENNRRRFEAEKALRKLRLTYFGVNRDPEKRAAGLAIVRTYTDPATYPALLAAFEREGEDVRLGVLDHLAALANADGDINLAYAAVYDHDQAVRAAAGDRLARRAEATGGVPTGVKSVIAAGLRFGSSMGPAADLVNRLNLIEAIPALIQAQTAATAGSGDGDGYRAFIVIGRQISFVSDLTPVVGTGAVGFDPTVSVLTEGSVLGVRDAFVTQYTSTVLPALRAIGSRAWGGRSVEHLGADAGAWRAWYEGELVPYLAGVKAEEGARRRP